MTHRKKKTCRLPRREPLLSAHALDAALQAPPSPSPAAAAGRPAPPQSDLAELLLLCVPAFIPISRSKIVMEDAKQSGFKLPPEFQEDARAPIIEPNSTDSTELWLIQWPKDQIPDFDGQRISLDLHHDDGRLGTVEGSSGKSYDVVSLATQEPKATVFLSAANSKIVGKITRRVSFVHYLEPSEVPKDDTKKLKQLYEMSSYATSLTNSANHFATPTKSRRSRHHSHSSGRKSSLTEEKARSKDSKASSRSTLDSIGRGQEPSDSVSEHSQEKKAKKRKKHVA